MKSQSSSSVALCHQPSGRAWPWAIQLKLLAVIVVSVALVFTGAARAMAMNHPMGVESLVICAEGGPTVIYLDASGQPVDPMVDCSKCPECLNNLPHILSNSVVAPEKPFICETRLLPPSAPAVTLSRHLRPQTRGPPVAPTVTHATASFAVRSSFGIVLFASPSDRTERAFQEARS